MNDWSLKLWEKIGFVSVFMTAYLLIVVFITAYLLAKYVMICSACCDGSEETSYNFPIYIPEFGGAGVPDGAVALRNGVLKWLGGTGDNTLWGTGVKIAILDTGIADHIAFKNTIKRIKEGHGSRGVIHLSLQRIRSPDASTPDKGHSGGFQCSGHADVEEVFSSDASP